MVVTYNKNMQCFQITPGPISSCQDDNPNTCPAGYPHPLYATFFNPFFDAISNGTLWACDGEEPLWTDGIRTGFAVLRPRYCLPMPVLTHEDCIRFGLYCALHFIDDKKFINWYVNWIRNTNRTPQRATFVNEEILKDTLLFERETIGSGFGVLQSVIDYEKAPYWSACAAWKAYHESEGLLEMLPIMELIYKG